MRWQKIVFDAPLDCLASPLPPALVWRPATARFTPPEVSALHLLGVHLFRGVPAQAAGGTGGPAERLLPEASPTHPLPGPRTPSAVALSSARRWLGTAFTRPSRERQTVWPPPFGRTPLETNSDMYSDVYGPEHALPGMSLPNGACPSLRGSGWMELAEGCRAPGPSAVPLGRYWSTHTTNQSFA